MSQGKCPWDSGFPSTESHDSFSPSVAAPLSSGAARVTKIRPWRKHGRRGARGPTMRRRADQRLFARKGEVGPSQSTAAVGHGAPQCGGGPTSVCSPEGRSRPGQSTAAVGQGPHDAEEGRPASVRPKGEVGPGKGTADQRLFAPRAKSARAKAAQPSSETAALGSKTGRRESTSEMNSTVSCLHGMLRCEVSPS